MRIINQTKNTILAEEAILADTPIKRIKGLLGRKELNWPQGLVLKPCNSVHTFFMHFPIDVLFVSRDNKVVALYPSLKPFRITPVYFRAKFAVELPQGTIAKANIEAGDILCLAPQSFSVG